MRKAALAIVIKDDHLLVMQRNKFGSEYVVLPGGEVEPGETPEQTALRELDEETSITAENPRLVFIDHAEELYGDHSVFLCEYVAGEPALRPDSVEAKILEHTKGANYYSPCWLPLAQLKDTVMLSHELKHALIAAIKDGWPEKAQEFTSTRNV